MKVPCSRILRVRSYLCLCALAYEGACLSDEHNPTPYACLCCAISYSVVHTELNELLVEFSAKPDSAIWDIIREGGCVWIS